MRPFAHAKNARCVTDLGAPVLNLIAPKPGETILDLGCGASATAMDFDHRFDAVFSNAVLHWIKDADAVIIRVAHAPRPGGDHVRPFASRAPAQRRRSIDGFETAIA
jgi:trans-aconitate methyltransferase